LALALEEAEPDVMTRPPRPVSENLLGGAMGRHILWSGGLMAGVTLGLQAYAVKAGIAHWQSMVFVVLSLSQLGHVFAIRRDSELVFKSSIGSNLSLYGVLLLTFILQLAVIYLPFANRIFRTNPLSAPELLVCIGLSSIVFHAVEAEKWIRTRFFHAKTNL